MGAGSRNGDSMTDPYDHMREAFHIVAEGLMSWEDPPERRRTDSDAIPAAYRAEDITTLEGAADALSRAGEVRHAIALWAIALRIRQAL